MERENLVASCKKLIAEWGKTADEKWEKLILKKKILTEKWMKFTNVEKVFCAGIASLVIFIFLLVVFQICFPKLLEKSAGLWNFIIVVVSAPVAFVIWHFRDENNRQQIENQRKDINLKEFQKLSEWVSGAHLPEIKTIDKTTQKEGLKDKGEIDGKLQLIERTTEKTEEYGKKPHTEGFDTFGKREGAVALQISAVYNLLPFFRGDYGESFRRPAFNLLKSAWQAMQQDSLKKWETENLSDDEQQAIIEELELKADSPMGVALTHVLLSLNQKNTQLNMRDFPEMLPNLCLAGMNFHLSGVDEKARDWSGLNLSGVDFRGAHLRKVQFEESQLDGANLQNADLTVANLQHADLTEANLQNANLSEANLQNANLWFAELQNAYLWLAELQNANLSDANLQNANLWLAELQNAYLVLANLQNANLRECALSWEHLKQVICGGLTGSQIIEDDFADKFYPEWKAETDSEWETLTEVERRAVMGKFHDETGMYIY
ncbi:Type III effector pipB2 [Neisseria elongata subsp. glycolytica]|nr:Type III effector pipB2 [Neisseria elongata subsp. glycolytica]